MQMSDEEMRGIKIILDLIGNAKLCNNCSLLYVDVPLFEHGTCPNFTNGEEYKQMMESKFGLCDSNLVRSYVLLHFSDKYLNLLQVYGEPGLSMVYVGVYYTCDMQMKDRNIYEFHRRNRWHQGVWQERHQDGASSALDRVLDLFIHYFMNLSDGASVRAYRTVCEKLDALGDGFENDL